MCGTGDCPGVFSVPRRREGQNLDGVVGELPQVLQDGRDSGQAGDLWQGKMGVWEAPGRGSVQDLSGSKRKERGRDGK